MAREAARGVLPNSTETKIVVTGNARAWRTMLELRTSEGAEQEIRRTAVAVLRLLQGRLRAFSPISRFTRRRIDARRRGSRITRSDRSRRFVADPGECSKRFGESGSVRADCLEEGPISSSTTYAA